MAELDDTFDKSFLSIGSAAEFLGVSIDTLRRWEKKGKINVYRSPGGHRYFKKEELRGAFGTKYERTEPTIRSKQDRPIEEVEDSKNEIDELHEDSEASKVKIPPQTPIRIIREVEIQSIQIMDEPLPFIPEVTQPATPQPRPEAPEVPESKPQAPRVVVEERVVEVTEDITKSILEPSRDNGLQPIQIERQSNREIKKKSKRSKMQILAYVGIALFLIFDIALAILWFMSQRLVSPIP